MGTKPEQRRFRQELLLRHRLLASSRQARDRAALLPPGPERQKLLRDARLLKTTADTLSTTQLQSGRASKCGSATARWRSSRPQTKTASLVDLNGLE